LSSNDRTLIAFWAALMMLSLSLVTMSVTVANAAPLENNMPANSTTSDKNGTFAFTNLSAGNYTLTAYKCILGAMHFLGNAPINVNGNVENVTMKLSRSNDTCFSDFLNSTVNLTRGNYSISGTVLGSNRPGAEPAEIPYEDAQVKITHFTSMGEKA
jgi:hypothetical protein